MSFFRIFENAQQLERQASTLSTLAYENPAFDNGRLETCAPENSFQMDENPQTAATSVSSEEKAATDIPTSKP